MKKLAIIGAGDLGQLIAHHAIESRELALTGFYDDFQAKGAIIGNAKVLGNLAEIEQGFHHQVFDSLIIGIGYKHISLRRSLYDKYQGKIPFANLIHNKAIIDSSAEIGEGNVILAGCILDVQVKVGNNVFFNPACVISHDSEIGSHSFLGPSVNIAGFVSIGKGCFLGIATTIIDHIQVCDFVQTGASSTIIKDIKESGLYLGSPAVKR